MSPSYTTFVDTSVIPSDVFTYRDNEFYSLVEKMAGPMEAQLLKIQSIRTINSFLRISDLFDVFSIDTQEINDVKRQLCFMLNDDNFIVKPGIKASLDYLRDLFHKKQKEISSSFYVNRSNSRNTSSTNRSETDATSQPPDSTTSSSNDANLDHRRLIIHGIDEWCSKNGRNLNLNDLQLAENIDYFITPPSDENRSGSIRCACRVSANLFKVGNHVQLSNYYRHLKKGKCSMLKSKFPSNSSGDRLGVDANQTTILTQSTSAERNETFTVPVSHPSSRSKQTTPLETSLYSKPKRRKK